MTTLHAPWDRYALICELAVRFEQQPARMGKTALEKVVYLIQDACGVPCGYEFELYTYGPFSAELLGDLDTVQGLGGVRVSYGSSGVGGYEITPGPEGEEIRGRGAPFLAHAAQHISRVLRDFGGCSAKDLELRSTLVFAARDLTRGERPPSADQLVQVVRQIKPRFGEQAIRSALSELCTKGYVNASG